MLPYLVFGSALLLQVLLGGIAWGTLRTEVRLIGKQLDYVTKRFDAHEKETRL